jgi:carotenoid cleavage dioxygenase
MSESSRIESLERQLAELSRRLTVTEDEQAVRKLQHLYGYLIDKCLYRETVDLFTDDGEVRFHGGVYKGKAGVRRLYIERFQTRFTHGNNGPVNGFLLDHPQLQDIVDIQDDGVTALGRFRSMMQAGRHKEYGEQRQWWEGGIYENVYRKIDGVWRIHILNYAPHWHADFETGWANTPREYVPFPKQTFPDDPLGPDELLPDPWLWPEVKLFPFHGNHPVTDQPIVAERWAGDVEEDGKKQER